MFDRFGEVGSDHIFAAVHFEVVLESTIESIIAKLMTKHVQDPTTLGVGVAVKFTGVVEVETNDRLAEKVAF